jgi:hypothetical protein
MTAAASVACRPMKPAANRTCNATARTIPGPFSIGWRIVRMIASGASSSQMYQITPLHTTLSK